MYTPCIRFLRQCFKNITILVEAFGNTDYQAYRDKNSTGGDLLLFSDIKTFPVNITILVDAP
jgi:hypothetical protein